METSEERKKRIAEWPIKWFDSFEEMDAEDRRWWAALSQEERDRVLLETIEYGLVKDEAVKELSRQIVEEFHPRDIDHLNQLVFEHRRKSAR